MAHRRAEAQLTAKFPGGRAWYESHRRRASLSAAAVVVGDQMSINVNIGGNGCTDAPLMINARVAAVSNSAIVLADPRNPAVSAYTDAQYNAFAQMFDTVINPLDVAQFGAPSDVDNNQKVLLVFTKAVNERTPPNVEYYVGGLTHSRDLVAKADCPGSNFAEMFYLLVPDSLGTINGNSFMTKSFVTSVTDATIAHEYQHLINFARRKYLNPGAPQPSEELWLNEGLSHIAEELMFYRRSGRSSRANFGGPQIADSVTFERWYSFVLGNYLNYDDYVLRSTETSPFEAGDAVSTRGATWSFLRYSADRMGSSDGSLWNNLVNSGESGLTNLQNRLGVNAAGLQGMLRDFVISVYLDDFVAGIPATYTQPSWNMRSMYPRVTQLFGLTPPFTWPLPGTALADADTKAGTIQAGAFQVYRFRALAGADAFIRVTGTAGSALPSGIKISVVRIQ